MDENYLDQLLKEVEGHEHTTKKKRSSDRRRESAGARPAYSRQNASAMDDSLLQDVSSVAWSDSEIPMEDLSELDELDDLADLDLDSMDFEDLDFDAIDGGRVNPLRFEQELEDLEHLNIDENYLDDSENEAFEEEFNRMKAAEASLKEEARREKEQEELQQRALAAEQQQEPLSEADELAQAIREAEESKKSEAMRKAKQFGDEALQEEDAADLINAINSGNFGAISSSTPSLQEEGWDPDDPTYVEHEPEPEPPKAEEVQESKPAESEPLNIDNLMNEVFGDESGDAKAAGGASDLFEGASDLGDSGEDGSGMDDLFAMLGIEGDSETMEASSLPDQENEIPDFEIPPELQDVQDISETKKKKKTLAEILFGPDDDEDALTPEQEEELKRQAEEKKQAKLAAKEAKKEAKKKSKEEKNVKKKAAQTEKAAQQNAKKEARKAEEARILAEEGPEKKLNKPLVIIIMAVFLGIGGLVIIGTNLFDYRLAISRAENFFERQKYGNAYRQILGVEVKESDKDLESRIYTVMYVERQYEAYLNYVKMNRPDLALDALLRGLDKYDEYYSDAVELDIVADIDYAKAEIVASLMQTYGMTEQDAKTILELDNVEYTDRIQTLTANMSFAGSEE